MSARFKDFALSGCVFTGDSLGTVFEFNSYCDSLNFNTAISCFKPFNCTKATKPHTPPATIAIDIMIANPINSSIQSLFYFTKQVPKKVTNKAYTIKLRWLSNLKAITACFFSAV